MSHNCSTSSPAFHNIRISGNKQRCCHLRTSVAKLGAALTTILCVVAFQPVVAAETEAPIDPIDREYWSFAPVTRPEVPRIAGGWSREPIDQFIKYRLRESQLESVGEASKTTLIRRVTFDLTGLPPTPDELDRFRGDDRPDAYERLVDRLLASPAYGERCGQHWLDLARFAETDGFEHDKVRPNAWRYRDWVIQAMNEDLPYDDFVRMQIAGDLISPNDPDAVVATGFLLAGPDMPDINLKEERLHNFLNEMTGAVGSTFLGLTLGCAQCHDHKTDPISQLDFYRFRSHFENADVFTEKPLPGSADAKGRFIKTHDRQEPSYLRIRGDFRRKGPVVEAAVLRVITPGSASTAGAEQPRKQLARWIASPDNPLAMRTIANRIWQHHFGRGIVESSSDLGYAGTEPTHPDLLTWLATELTRIDSSLKNMSRHMVCSSTYRQTSCVDSTDRPENDPDNDLLWKMHRRRLEGEAIRDAMLVASGRLNRMNGGPGIRPPLPKEIVGTLLKNQWPVSTDIASHNTRSIYVFVRRNLRFPIFDVFDKPDGNASCAVRNESVTAPQSLSLFNSEFSYECAHQMCVALKAQPGIDTRRFINEAFERCLGRRPTEKERILATRFLDDNGDSDAVAFCLSLLNLNEFVYVD